MNREMRKSQLFFFGNQNWNMSPVHRKKNENLNWRSLNWPSLKYQYSGMATRLYVQKLNC